MGLFYFVILYIFAYILLSLVFFVILCFNTARSKIVSEYLEQILSGNETLRALLTGPVSGEIQISESARQLIALSAFGTSDQSQIAHPGYSSEAQFACRRCGKRYRWKSTMRRHEQVECGGKEPMYQCPHCPYRAKQKGNLGVHVRKHHFKDDPSFNDKSSVSE